MSKDEYLPPNFGKLDTALRSIGYSFEAAVADVIDNSVDAQASHVLLRLVTRIDGHLDLLILDDGEGMDADGLKEAMRFGSDVSSELDRLGKFGLGLKLASLSQGRALRVVTSNDGIVSGRAWLEEGISKGFTSTVLDGTECNRLTVLVNRRSEKSGTLVHWSNLYRVGHSHSDPEEHAQKLLNRLRQHLSIAFHRFLDGKVERKGGQLTISMDIMEEASGRTGLALRVEGLNPFNYPSTGRAGFPAEFRLRGAHADAMTLRAHIWPPNSTTPEYKLPGGSNARQGFYFYRNNRLLQAGGWNRLREAEPHLSLARIEIDLAAQFDVDVSLDVKKVEIQLPPGLAKAISESATADGTNFKEYISAAEGAYRKRTLVNSELPLIPSEGLNSRLASFLRSELRLEGTQKFRDLRIVWSKLDDSEFFRIDRVEGCLYLNKSLRRALLHGLPGSSADLPVVKCLLFLVLEEALSSERMGARMREKIELTNRILLKAVQFERTAS